MVGSNLRKFPTVQWKRESATFVATAILPPPNEPVPAPAALVFPFYGDRVVLADIPSRGWCIPSGHVESGENAEQAVRREAWEEAGITLGTVACLGYFILTENTCGHVRHAPTFLADVRGIESVPPGSESRGMQMVPMEDVAGLYFVWDDLLAAVFEYAAEEKVRLLRPGVSLSELFADGQELHL